MGILSQLIKRVKDKQMGMAQPVGRGGVFFGGLPIGDMRMPDQETLDKFRQVASRPNPFVRKMPIGDMRLRDPRFERRRRPSGLAGLFGRMPEKVPFGPVSQPEIMAPQMMQPQIFGRPTEGISFSDINIENIPTLPDFSQGLPPEILERIQGNMQRMGRLPFADGDEASITDFLNADPEQVAFGIEAQINNLMGEYEMAVRNGEMERAKMLNDQINELDKMKIDIAGRTISDMDRQMIKGYAEGGEAFPDLTGDGKVTKADILKGRGVFAEGDEVSMMMMELEGDEGMPAGDMEGLEELGEISGPETEMLNNIINQIIELIVQGATEEEIIQFLMEQGLDQEDITAVMSMLSEQLTAGEEEGIDSQLAALG